MTILLALLACNDSPSGDSAVETPLTCAGWCGVIAEDCGMGVGASACIEYCEADAREADAFEACWAGAEESWEIDKYGWDYDACYATVSECGATAGG